MKKLFNTVCLELAWYEDITHTKAACTPTACKDAAENTVCVKSYRLL
jgi:hypothetical protein